MDKRDSNLLSLLRYALNVTEVPPQFTENEWQQLFEDSCRHTLVGVLFEGVQRLQKQDKTLCPPLLLMLRWAGDAENIALLSREMNAEAARLTNLLEHEGHNTVILKGQANALLYPQPQRRQLLKKVLRTGNFGQHDRQKQDVLWREVLRQKIELLPLVWFEPEFALTLAAEEYRYWWCIVSKLPERIRHRSLSLRDHPDTWG